MDINNIIILGSIGIVLILLKKLTNKKKPNNIQKGKLYEEFIAHHYKDKGYEVIERGKIMGKKDGGIDIIAKNDDEILLIQCKNYDINSTWKIRQKDIKAFRMDCLDFIEENNTYKTENTKAIFIISDNFIDNGAKNYIKEKQNKGKKIEYKIIPIN